MMVFQTPCSRSVTVFRAKHIYVVILGHSYISQTHPSKKTFCPSAGMISSLSAGWSHQPSDTPLKKSQKLSIPYWRMLQATLTFQLCVAVWMQFILVTTTSPRMGMSAELIPMHNWSCIRSFCIAFTIQALLESFCHSNFLCKKTLIIANALTVLLKGTPTFWSVLCSLIHQDKFPQWWRK